MLQRLGFLGSFAGVGWVLLAGCSSDAPDGHSPASAGGGGVVAEAGSSGESSGRAGAEDRARGGDGGDGGAGQTRGPSIEEFCPAWIEAFAGLMARCDCDSGTVARYRESASVLCEPSGYLGALIPAVRDGAFTYHPDAARALLGRLELEDAPCLEEPFRALHLDSEELYSLAGVFVGTRELGEACAHPVSYKGGLSDCRTGFCAPDRNGAGNCIAFVPAGAECDASGDTRFEATVARLCHAVRGADADGEYESAFDALACVPTEPNGATQRCVGELPDGAECTASAQCESGLCLVVGSEAAGECSAKLPDGEPCDADELCASGTCATEEPRICRAVPAATRLPGDPCTLSSECISDGHGASRNRVCQDGRCVNDICAAYAERFLALTRTSRRTP